MRCCAASGLRRFVGDITRRYRRRAAQVTLALIVLHFFIVPAYYYLFVWRGVSCDVDGPLVPTFSQFDPSPGPLSWHFSSLFLNMLISHSPYTRCEELRKFGTDERGWGGHDGHHICTAVLQTNCLVYSFGIDYDFSFDDALAKQGCQVYSFDPSMDMGNHTRDSGVKFYRLGLYTSDVEDFTPAGRLAVPLFEKSNAWQTGWMMRQLDTLMTAFGHRERLSLLKIDIEGDEWYILDWLLQRTELLGSIDQIELELHLTEDWTRQMPHFYRLWRHFLCCSPFRLVFGHHWRGSSWGWRNYHVVTLLNKERFPGGF